MIYVCHSPPSPPLYFRKAHHGKPVPRVKQSLKHDPHACRKVPCLGLEQSFLSLAQQASNVRTELTWRAHNVLPSRPPTPMLSITLVLSEERERESECAVVKCFRLHNTIQSKEFHRVEYLQNTSGSSYSKLAFELHQRSQVIAHDESMLGFIQVSCNAHRSWKKKEVYCGVCCNIWLEI